MKGLRESREKGEKVLSGLQGEGVVFIFFELFSKNLWGFSAPDEASRLVSGMCNVDLGVD